MARQPQTARPMAESMVQHPEDSKQDMGQGKRALLNPPATLVRLPMGPLASSRQAMEDHRSVPSESAHTAYLESS